MKKPLGISTSWSVYSTFLYCRTAAVEESTPRIIKESPSEECSFRREVCCIDKHLEYPIIKEQMLNFSLGQ